MREAFRGYYHPTEGELSDWWKEGLFVFDANVLLHLFRYPKSARDELVQLLQMICHQAWIPHQVGLEFHRARLDVVSDQFAAYDNVSQILNEAEKQIADKLSPLTNRHLFLDTQFFLDQLKKTYRGLHEHLDKLKKEHPDKVDNEAILKKVTELFANRVGPSYQAKKLEEIYEKARQRYEKRIPPGYADEKSKKNDERKYGDLVLWFQVIDKASEIKKPIIFVTDDEKEDWWRKSASGQILGPRPELIHEMRTEGGVDFYMYILDKFMEEAKKRRKIKVSDRTLETAREIRKAQTATGLLSREEFEKLMSALETSNQEQLLQHYHDLFARSDRTRWLTEFIASRLKALTSAEPLIDGMEASTMLGDPECARRALDDDLGSHRRSLLGAKPRK